MDTEPNAGTGQSPAGRDVPAQEPVQQQAPSEQQPAPSDTTPASPAIDLAKVRELVLAAHPDVVAELVGGESFDAILASVEPARSAYQRITERVRQQGQPAAASTPSTPAPAPPPSVPAGQPGRSGLPSGFEDLSPSAKIAEGLRRRGTQLRPASR